MNRKTPQERHLFTNLSEQRLRKEITLLSAQLAASQEREAQLAAVVDKAYNILCREMAEPVDVLGQTKAMAEAMDALAWGSDDGGDSGKRTLLARDERMRREGAVANLRRIVKANGHLDTIYIDLLAELADKIERGEVKP